jgi:hypothetical protein
MRHMPRLALASAVIAGAIAVPLLASTGSASATTSRTTSSSITAQLAELRGSDTVAGDFFGGSVAISGNTAVVGADQHASLAGAAYVFRESGGVWKQVAELKGSDTVAGDMFGVSVAISGNTAVVGADGRASYTGSAYVFTESGGVWKQAAELKGSDTVKYDTFGYSVALSGSLVVVGAPQLGSNVEGRAYLFSETAGVWKQVAELRGSDTVASDFFGASVAVSGTTALVGAFGHNANAGRAYMFAESKSAWEQVAEWKGSGIVAGDLFGSSVAASGPTALIGAPGINASHAGPVYVFDILGSVLGVGEGLSAGESLQSVGGQFSLVMQRDGNLVLYTSSSRALWSSGTENNAGASVVMQRDGNLVVYSSSDRALWASGTENNAGASAVLQRDGNFVIYSASGKALWSSGT